MAKFINSNPDSEVTISDQTLKILADACHNTKAAREITEAIDYANNLGIKLQENKSQIDLIGKGLGVNKTDTAVHGITITEDFGVNDEIFLHWVIPYCRIARTMPVTFILGLFPITAEVGKTVSFDINILSSNGGTDNSSTGDVLQIVDVPLPATAYQSTETSLVIPASYVAEPYQDLHMRVRRVASSNDLVGDVAVHHTTMHYYTYVV